MARDIASIRSAFAQGIFVMRNAVRARGLPILPQFTFGDVLIGPFETSLAQSVADVYSVLNNGQPLALKKRVILNIAGNRYCLVAQDINRNVIGLALYYFNSRDIRESTIHEGYIGLLPEYRGRGLGREIRSRALNHFVRVATLQGMSSRVSIANVPSLKGNLQLGFRRVEQYCDEVTGEERCYLVRHFRETSHEDRCQKQGA